MRHSCALSGLKQPEKLIRQHLFPLSIFDGEGARGQCHLNKKNVAEALLFEGKALLPGSLAMERGISALDNARVKAEAAWGQQGGRFAQIGQESLLQPGDLLARDQGKLIAGGVQHLDGMREAETIGVQVGLAGGLMHPPAHDVMGQQQPVEFLSHQAWFLAAQRLAAQPQMVLLLIDAGFDLPALMIAVDELEGRSLLRIQQSRH